MTKKVLLFIGINLLLLTNSHAISKRDSIYYDLYTYLVSAEDMPQSMKPKLGSKNYEQYLYIFSILKDDFPNKPDFVNIPFGIYKFQYEGCIDCGFYALIKHNESYKVYSQTSVTLIIKELIKIRKENPDLIADDLFEAYIEAIVDDELGMYGGRPVIFHTIGHIECYR
jgi:hypothetical protein